MAAWIDGILDVDQTGVGATVIDPFQQEGLEPVGVLIHGGDKASHEGESWRVPKRDVDRSRDRARQLFCLEGGGSR